MLWILNHKYYSYNNNIKCVDSTIKYNFKSSHYAINLNIVSFFFVYSDFDSIFLLFELIKLFLFSKKKCEKVSLSWKPIQ